MMGFPIHHSAASSFCRYCGHDGERNNLKYIRNTINGKIIAVCEHCYEKRLLELALYFDDSSEDELTVSEIMYE